MKGKKFISLILAAAMIFSTLSGLTLTASAADAAYSWGFEDGTDGLTISNDNLIKVEDLDAGQSKTEAASPSGQVLYIGSKSTTGTGNAYVTLPKDVFVDENGKIKDEFQVSFDINSTDSGWRYAFYVGDGTTANSLYFVPAGAVVGGTKPVYGTRAEVFGKNATKDSRVMTLNKWVHVDIIKKGNTFAAYEDGERFGTLDNDAVASLSGDADKMFAAMGYSPHNDPGLNAYIDNLTIYNTADEQLLNRTKTIYCCYWDTETTGTKAQAGTDSSTEVYSDKGGQRFLIEADGDLSKLDSVSISNGWDSTGGNTCTINVYALTEKPSSLDSADLQNPVGTFVQSKDFDWGYLTGEVSITGEIPADAKYLAVTQENSGGGTTRVYAENIYLSYNDAEKEPQPQITINYTDETLDGFTAGGKYVITADGGVNDTETISEGTTLPIKDTYFGKTLSIVKKSAEGAGNDSPAQSLTVKTRPAAPTLTVNQPNAIGGKGSIFDVDDTMEYSIDAGESWTQCEGELIDDIEPGTTVLVRVAATSSSFKSNNASATISEFGAEPEAVPEIAIDFTNEKLTGFGTGSYMIDGTEVTPVDDELDIVDYIGKTIEIVKKGNGIETTDSEAQTLNIPARPAAPERSAFTVTDPDSEDGKGSISGITADMEYSVDEGVNWIQGSGDAVEAEAGAKVLVREMATESSFKSAELTLTVGYYIPEAVIEIDENHVKGDMVDDTYDTVFDALSLPEDVMDYDIAADADGIFDGWSSTWTKVADSIAQTQMNANFISNTGDKIRYFQFYGSETSADSVAIYTPGYAKNAEWFAIDFIMTASNPKNLCHDSILLDSEKKPFFGYAYAKPGDGFYPGDGERSFDEDGTLRAANGNQFSNLIEEVGNDKCDYTSGSTIMRLIVDDAVKYNGEKAYAVTSAYSNDGGSTFTVISTRYYSGSVNGFGGIQVIAETATNWYSNTRYGNMKIYAEKSAQPSGSPEATTEPTLTPETTTSPSSSPSPTEPGKDYSKRLFHANFDEGTIAAVDGKIINSGATVTEDNGNKVADLGGSAHMAITKTDGSPILKDLETAAIHIRAKATGSNKTDWYFFAAESAAAPSGGSEKYIGAFNNNAGVINFERYKGGRGNPGVTVTSAKNEWHDLDFLFNEKTMEIYVDGKFKKAQSHDDVKLSDILGSADTQIFYIGKATWGNGEYMNGMVDDISVYGIAPITDIENKNITDTLVLPKAAADAGYSIKWTSDNTDVISIDDSGAATVTLPTADTSVTLTAQITYGDITISKDINVTVQGQTALTVTVDSDAADNVSVDKTEAHLGDEINVTVTAPEGKVIKDVKAGDTSILTSGRKGAYKFNMPSTNVTVTAEFEDKKQTAVFRFEDDTADGITYLRDGSAGTMEFAAGKTGNALKLTPSAKNGYYGKLDKFPLALSFSVGAWIKPADMNTWWQRVFDFGIGENNSIFVTTLGETPNSGTSGTYRVDAFGSGIDSPKKLTANEWAYITVTYDEASDTLTLYLNGESVGTAVCTKNMAEVYSGTANYIGKSQYAADALYNGLIDEMVIYNYAITADEIKTLMGTEAAPTNEPTSTPTSVPTDAPTSVPTDAPTSKPTSVPTDAPTIKPTSVPTDAPTSKPTSVPTDAPTSKPTSVPTDAPTSKPTSVPTNAPTSKPTDAPTSTPTLKPTDTPSPKYAVSGTITNADNTAAKNVKLTLKPTDAHTLTDENGFYAFSDVETGIYNLIVEYDDKTITMLIKVENKDVVIDVNLPATGVSSALEVKGENTPDIIVGGLDKLADEIAEAAGRDAVTEVKMTVESKPENTADPAQKAIKKKSGDSKIEYIDIVIVKTVDNETEEISKTGNLITIVIPFATEGKSNIRVYRYHGGKAESMSNSGSGERCEVGDGFVTIYAQKFSTYAIAYDEKPQSSTEPTTKPVQGSTSSHSSRRTSTTPSPKPTATPEATEEPVSSEAPIESSEPTSAPLSPDTLPFDDVHSTDWFYDAVKFAYDNGLMNGVAETEFGPGMTLTRGMLVTILGRMDGAPQAMETNEYTDIDRNAYYAPYVAWGTANGILNGFGDGTFRPDEAVTREQTAKIIKCYYDCKGEGPVGAWAIGLDYSDTDRISDWAAEGVMFCAMKGIMTGRENGTFDPKANITRAEFAVTISRID